MLASAARRLKDLSLNSPRRNVESLWREFFADPSCWWDNRAEKANPRYPDFKHKKTRQPLWLNSKMKPQWVEAELATIALGTVNVFGWNRRLARHAKAGQNEETIRLFRQMQREGMIPNMFSFFPVLNACSTLRALQEGKRIHLQIIQSGLESDVYVGSCLIDMYANCGSIADAQVVFNSMPTRDVVSWTAMILGHVKCGQGHKALRLFRQMRREGVNPNPVTFVGVLNACASLAAVEEGRRLHEHIIRQGWESNVFVGSSLVDMYAKCGSIEDAQTVFNKMPERGVVSWTAMILGHVKCGHAQQALDLFGQMLGEGVDPNPVTFVGVLNACASMAAMDEGRRVHEQIIRRGCVADVFVGNSLVDMYSKCGSIEDAWTIFNTMTKRDVVSWNAMLGGYAMHGRAEEALEHFERMHQEGIEMDEVTFLSVLSACSHAGLVDEGLHHLESMMVYGISPRADHYASVVDLLARAGHLHEAENLLTTMIYEPKASVWLCLLGACRVHANVMMGESVAKRVAVLDPENAGGHVLLSNLYAGCYREVRCQRIYSPNGTLS